MAEPARGNKPTNTEAESERAPADLTERAARMFRWGLPAGSIAAALIVGFSYDFGMALLVLAGGVLLGIIAILWESVRTLSGDAPITLEEALSIGAPSAAEEQKRAVL